MQSAQKGVAAQLRMQQVARVHKRMLYRLVAELGEGQEQGQVGVSTWALPLHLAPADPLQFWPESLNELPVRQPACDAQSLCLPEPGEHLIQDLQQNLDESTVEFNQVRFGSQLLDPTLLWDLLGISIISISAPNSS